MGGYELHHKGKVFTPDGDLPVASTKEESDARNAALSAAEVQAFKDRKGDRWFGYWHELSDRPEKHNTVLYGKAVQIHTWMGGVLAIVYWRGREYCLPAFGGFPSRRINFRARGIDGRTWYGTYYVSSGQYVRMRVMK